MNDISALTNVSSDIIKTAVQDNEDLTASNDRFDAAMSTAMSMISETNGYQKDREEAQIQFALGEATNTHDLQIAQEKANVSLQYTVAVRDKLLSAYKEIMNMQI